MTRLAGKVAIVTGAAQGIGAGIAELFAEHGATVLVCDVNVGGATAVADRLTSRGWSAEGYRLDVTDEAQWRGLVDDVLERHGAIDVLVSNAGLGSDAGLEEESLEAWQRVVAVNQTGVWLGIKAVVPSMREAGRGSLVNVCSIMGIAGDIDHATYQATKGAVRMISKNAALSYVGDGVRSNTVCPGMIATDMAEEEDPAVLEEWLSMTPMHRHGTVREVAYGALFLASDESSYVTGTDLVIDGGYLAR